MSILSIVSTHNVTDQRILGTEDTSPFRRTDVAVVESENPDLDPERVQGKKGKTLLTSCKKLC